MSVFSKLLDKLGLRKKQERHTIIGTAEVASPDPLSTTPTPASKAASRKKSTPATKPAGPAPVSEQDVKSNNKRSTGKRGKGDDIA